MKNTKKTLIIISIIIIVLGIIRGVLFSMQLNSTVSNNNERIYIDGSDFTDIFSAFKTFCLIMFGMYPILLNLIIVTIIWIIYWINSKKKPKE